MWAPWPEAILGLGLFAAFYVDVILGGYIWPYAPALLVATGLAALRAPDPTLSHIRRRPAVLLRCRPPGAWRSTLLRVVFALCLLGVLCVVYDVRFPQQKIFRNPFAPGPTMLPKEVGQFAGLFVGVLLTMQGLAVLILTPAYLGGAIAEEKSAARWNSCSPRT